MGCGASSLKGDDVPAVNSQPVPASQQLKKVRTDFSSVDYDQDARRRRLTEYAPHETPAPIREQSYDMSAEQQESFAYSQQAQFQTDDGAPGQLDPNAGASTGYPRGSTGQGAQAGDYNPNTALKPYQTFDGGDWDDNANANANHQRDSQPYVNGAQYPNDRDPTSGNAKDQFASTNDPANPLNQDPHHGQNNQAHHARPSAGNRDQMDPNYSGNDDDPNYYATNPDANDPDQAEHKKSWLGQKYANYQSMKRGTGPSDEDVLRYTGKDRDELNEWSRDQPGVGGNQEAGLASGAPWN